MAKSSVKEFLKRKNVNITVQTYLIDALGAMAFGLFASLLIGTIFGTLGQQFQIEIFNVIADYAKSATGAALGIAIAHALKAPQLVLFSAATVGIAGNALGGPVGALVATIVAAELGKIVSKETRLDIIVMPGITIISGVLVAQFVGPGVAQFMNWFGNLVKTATEMQPFIMGILVSALIGIALTLPIPPGKHPSRVRHGHLRTGRPHRRIYGHGRRNPDVGGHPSGVLPASRCADLCVWGGAAQYGVD